MEALAARIAGQDYSGRNGYAAICRSPPASLMIGAGLWIELQRSFVGLAIGRLEPSALPMAAGVAGGFMRSGGTLLLPESATAAACVIVA